MLHCRHIVKMLGPDVCVCFWLLMPVGMAMWGFMGSGDCVFFEGGSSSSLLFPPLGTNSTVPSPSREPNRSSVLDGIAWSSRSDDVGVWREREREREREMDGWMDGGRESARAQQSERARDVGSGREQRALLERVSTPRNRPAVEG